LIFLALWALRLSKMTKMGSPSGRAARQERIAARELSIPFLARTTPHKRSSPIE
jgi:hypothetical protein